MNHAQLGHFTLRRRLGRGGMGLVYEGVHAPSGRRIALKTPQRVRDAAARRRFIREAQAAASLRDPSIVRVLDYGSLARALDVDGDVIPAGAPFVVMELVDGVPLDARALRAHLGGDPRRGARAILRALAVAHAAGVAHLDLKPGNVLVDPSTGAVTLIDFGMARWGDDAHAAAGGTLAYMAPEQALGARGWGVGPRADVFALGVMVYAWLTGHPPFVGLGLDALLAAKRAGLTAEARDAVPDSWRPWIQVALTPEPHARFAFAADALDALDALDDAGLAPELPEGSPPQAGSSFWRSSSLWTPTQAATQPEATAPARFGRADLTLPEAPPVGARGEAALRGVGLGVLAWRATPTVGRAALMEDLWSSARHALTSPEPRSLWLCGAPGVGKTHLARWLTRALGAAGVATWTVAREPGEPSSRAARRALATWTRTHGMTGRALEERASARLSVELGLGGEDVYRALTLLEPPERARVREEDHLEAFARVVLACAAARPTLLVVEDEDLDDGVSSAWLDALPERAQGAPLFVLRTHRGAPPAPGIEALTVGPLEPEAHAELVSMVLDLDPDDAADLHARTEGNPLFTLELVRAWARRGALSEGARGFALAPSGGGPLPERILEACRARLRPALDDPALSRATLHLATLGPRFDADHADAVVGALGLGEGDDPLERLRGLGLLDATEDGWRWANRTLHEASAREVDLLPSAASIRAASARALAALERTDASHVRLLLDLHARAGELDDALARLRDYLPTASTEASAEVIEALAARVEARPTPERRAIVALSRASVSLTSADFEQMAGALDEARAALPDPGHPLRLRADIMENEARVISGDYARVLELGPRLLERAQGSPHDELNCRRALADAHVYSGAPARALGHLERALELCGELARVHRPWNTAWTRYQLANAYDELGRADDALAQCALAEEYFGRTHDGSGLGSCLLVRAAIAARTSRHADALELCARARAALAAWGDGAWVLARDGEARALIELGMIGRARPIVDELAALVGVNDYVTGVDDLALLLASAEADWGTWDEVAGRLSLDDYAYEDAAIALERCARACLTHDEGERAAWASAQASLIRHALEEHP